MCVIVFKPGNIALPSKEDLEKMAKANDDGQGFMYPWHGDVVGEKFEKVEKMYERLRRVPNGIPIVMHFRLATHGGKGMAYAQPFPFPVEEQEELYKTEWMAPLGAAHNGILSGFGDSMWASAYGNATYLEDGKVKVWDGRLQKWMPLEKKEKEKKKMSDTQDFLKYLSDDRNLCRAFMNWDKAVLKLMGKLLSSKWAFLNGRGKVKLIGDWSQKKGVWYSNLYWVNRVVYTAPTNAELEARREKWKRERDHWTAGKVWDHVKGRWVYEDEKGKKTTTPDGTGGNALTENAQDELRQFQGMFGELG